MVDKTDREKRAKRRDGKQQQQDEEIREEYVNPYATAESEGEAAESPREQAANLHGQPSGSRVVHSTTRQTIAQEDQGL